MIQDLEVIADYLQRALDQDGGPLQIDDRIALSKAFEGLSARLQALEKRTQGQHLVGLE